MFYKQKEVTNNLTRIGHIDLPEATPILGSEKQYFYRNKMEFSFSDSRWLTIEEINSDKDLGDKNALGFHIPGMWDKILDINQCHLQEDPSNDIRNAVKKFAVSSDDLNPKVSRQVEIEIKYEGYIQRQLKEIEKFKNLEKMKIPQGFDFTIVHGLSNELKEKQIGRAHV